MAKYKVKVIAILCKNNYKAKFGEVVDESQLNSKACDLVNEGFIEPFVGEVVDESQSDLSVGEEASEIDVKEAKQVKPNKKN